MFRNKERSVQPQSHVIGQNAEQLACDYLQTNGLQLLCKNFRCRSGEIDLIMKDGDELVFVEVKFRKSSHYGHPAEYFHASKRRKFESALQYFMLQKGLNPTMVPHRIDLIAIKGTEIDWMRHI